MTRLALLALALSGCTTYIVVAPPPLDASPPSDAADASVTIDAFTGDSAAPCPGMCETFGAISYWHEPYRLADGTCATSIARMECRLGAGCESWIGCLP